MTKGKLSRRSAFLLTFLLLIFGMLNSQVRIKERVEIEPKFSKQDTPMLSTGNNSKTMTASLTVSDGVMGRIYWRECGEYHTNAGIGTVTISSNKSGFIYAYFQVRIAELDYGQCVTVKLQINDGNTTVVKKSGVLCGRGSYEVFVNVAVESFYSSWYATYLFGVGNLLIYEGDENNFNITPIRDCALDGVWNLTDPIKVSIIDGAENGSFFLDKVDKGAQIELPYEQMKNLRFVAKEFLPGSEPEEEVKIKTESNGIVREGSFKIRKHSSRILHVSAPQEMIADRHENLCICLMDSAGNVLSTPSSYSYTVEIQEGAEYLSLGGYFEPKKSSIVVSAKEEWSCVMLNTYGTEISEPKTVNIKVTPNVTLIAPKTLSIIVNPNPIKLIISPNVTTYRTTVSLQLKLVNPDGSFGVFPSDDNIWFFIVAGSGAGYLLSSDGSQRNKSYIYGNSPEAFFITEETETQPDTIEIVIVAGAGDGWIRGKLLVVKNLSQLDHFNVNISPDTIVHGESAKITVLAVDANGNEVVIDGNTQIKFTASPEGFGTFLLEGSIPYSQAKAGVMKYISIDQKIPGSGYKQIQIIASGLGKSGSASVMIKNKPCEDAPKCSGPPTLPKISLKELKRGDMRFDPCSEPPRQPGTIVGGGFRPLNEYENFEVQPCFNSETGNWQFSIPEITVKVYLDLCESNIAGAGKVFINSIYEILPGDYCTALMDFKDHLNYPVGDATLGPLPKRPMKYLIRPVFYKHEEIHKKQYQAILERLRPDFEKNILSYKPICEERKTSEEVINKAKQIIGRYFKLYLVSANVKREEDAGLNPYNPVKQDEHERIKTQGSSEYRDFLRTYFIEPLKKKAIYCIE